MELCMLNNFVTIDFETHPIEGSLPPKPVGVAIKVGDSPSEYLSWGHQDNNNTNEVYATQCLKKLFAEHPIIMHNASFDISVAKYWLGIDYPKKLHDTLILLFLRNPHARTLALKPSAEEILNMPPEEKDLLHDWIIKNVPKANKKNAGAFIAQAPVSLVAPYACADTDMTAALFNMMHPLYKGEAYDREMKLMPILCVNTLQGINVDESIIYKDFVEFKSAHKLVSDKIYQKLGSEFNIDSGVELANAIEKAGLNTQWIYTKTGKASTSKNNLLAAINDQELLDFLSYRGTLSTYLDTFMSSWISKNNAGRLHFNWNQVRNQETGGFMGTRTGRLSSYPSVLNVPKKPPSIDPKYNLPALPSMRKYFIPDAGQLWLSRDFNSQELRVLAHYEDGIMMQSYQENPHLDLHQLMSDTLTDALNKEVSRRWAKTIGFSILYGSGITALSEQLECSYDEAMEVKRAYLNSAPGIRDVQNKIKASWDIADPIKTWGGRYYFKEDQKMITDKRTGEQRLADFGYKGLNYLIQSSSADITKQAIINYNEIKQDGRFLLSVHDQIDISGPLSEMKLLKEAMSDIKLDVKLLSDGAYGNNMTTPETYDD
jgi:DNA polymerase-1